MAKWFILAEKQMVPCRKNNEHTAIFPDMKLTYHLYITDITEIYGSMQKNNERTARLPDMKLTHHLFITEILMEIGADSKIEYIILMYYLTIIAVSCQQQTNEPANEILTLLAL